MPALNNAQIEILKLFSHQNTEEELRELKQLLINFLSKKLVKALDESIDKKSNLENLNNWKDEHFRRLNN